MVFMYFFQKPANILVIVGSVSLRAEHDCEQPGVDYDVFELPKVLPLAYWFIRPRVGGRKNVIHAQRFHDNEIT